MPPRRRSPERVVFFSDAVVAIAITLLVLPLADAVPEAAQQHLSAAELISHNANSIYSFLLSFAVIARFWGLHHRLFEEVKAYSRPLLFANFGWLLAIVTLPFPTEIAGQYGNGQFESALYIGTIFVSSLFQLVMVVIIRRDRALREDDSELATRPMFEYAITTGMLAIALVVAALVPHTGYYMLLLLLAPPILDRIRRSRAPESV